MCLDRTVEVERRNAEICIFHRGTLVARHPELAGRHQLSIDPAHGPGAIARNARSRLSRAPAAQDLEAVRLTEVEVRDLGIYEQLLEEVLS